MPINDSWDWPVLLYIGTVTLRRTEAQFWRMTPRKLNALSRAHVEMNPVGDDKDDNSDRGEKFVGIETLF